MDRWKLNLGKHRRCVSDDDEGIMDKKRKTEKKGGISDDEGIMDKKRKTEKKGGISIINHCKLGKQNTTNDDDETIAEKKRKISSIRSPPASKSNEKEKKLFICCSRRGTAAIWYKINPSKNTTNVRGDTAVVENLSPICQISSSEMRKHFTPVAAPVGDGSKIYMVGGWDWGQSEATKDVFVLETRNPFIHCSKKCSRMFGSRTLAKAVSTNGKIYVFGSPCGGSRTPVPWAEVFDPDTNQWSPLPEPPAHVIEGCSSSFVSTAVVGNNILLCVNNQLISFDVKCNTWGRDYSTPLSITSRWGYGPTTLDGVMYVYCNADVIAYDLIQQRWFEKPVQGLGIPECSDHDPDELDWGCLVHVGNKSLCVVWDDSRYYTTRIRCVKFRVTPLSSPGSQTILRAEVYSRATYHLDGNFKHCLAL